MKIRVRVLISGSVQGVFFRVKTRNEALKHGLSGWVRNLPDGRVEAVFEGEEDRVKELVDFCKRGPSGARVTGIDVMPQSYRGEFKNFEIKYGHSF